MEKGLEILKVEFVPCVARFFFIKIIITRNNIRVQLNLEIVPALHLTNLAHN